MKPNYRARMWLACALRFSFFVAIGLTAATAMSMAQQRPTREGFMFSTADVNGDKLISPSEFSIILYPGSRRERELSRSGLDAFIAADKDGNGYLDLSEFSTWLQQRN